MKLFDTIIEKFTNKNKITELEEKIVEQTEVISKSLNSSLAGIVDGQWVELNKRSINNPFNKHYTIFRGVQMSANNIATVPMNLYRGDTILQPEASLPGGFNIYQPNPTQAFNELLYQGLVYFFYRGEMFIHIRQKTEQNPFFSLEVLNPKHMVLQKDGTWKWDSRLIIPPEQLIYTKIFDPDSDRGLSPFDVIKQGLKSDLSAEEFNATFFKNFGQIGGTLQDKDGTASSDEMKRVTQQFNTAHGGVGNAHKTLGLPSGITFEEGKHSMKDMEFQEGRKNFRDESLANQGIHKALLGVTDSMNRSTNEEAYRQLWKITLKPVALQTQDKINQHLFKRYFPGYRLLFDFSDVDALKENEEVKIKNAEAYKRMGYSLNEVNEYFDLGMEVITDPIGDMRLVPSNMIPVDDYFIGDTETTPAKDIGDKIFNILNEEEVEQKGIVDKSRRSRNYARKYNKLQRSEEKKIHGKIGKYFANQLGKVISVIRKQGIDNTTVLLSAIMNLLNKENQVLIDTMRPVYQDGSSQAAMFARTTTNVKKSIDKDFTDHIDEVVESMVNKIVGINNSTYKLIRNDIKASIVAEESMGQITKKMTDIYKFNSSRSRTIARTESAAVISRSTDKVYRDNEVKKKEWISNMDSETRDTHAANHSEGVVLYDYIYSNGQQFPSDGGGGAGENINCRCTFAPVIE